MKKRVLKAIISIITAVSLLQANASALILPDGGSTALGTSERIEGWSSKVGPGQVYVVSTLSKHNSTWFFSKDSVTVDGQITKPKDARATKFSFSANISYNNGTTVVKNSDSKTSEETNYDSLKVEAGNHYASEGRGGVVMNLTGFGMFSGGTYIVF